MNDDRTYLGHILDCIAKIETYTTEGRAVFMKEPMIQDAVMRNLEIIGEAAKNVSRTFRDLHPEVFWRGAMELRNVLIHNYLGVKVDRVWSAVTGRLPKLKEQIQTLLSDLNSDHTA
jgi:uncharacterized protein with HEPN domain